MTGEALSIRERTEKRIRARRLFNEQLEGLAQRMNLKPEHLELVQGAPIELASEKIPFLEECLDQVLGDGEAYNRINETLSMFRNEAFFFDPFSGGRICVGLKGEVSSDETYGDGVASELVHTVLYWLPLYRSEEFALDSGVGEFYDAIFNWERDSEALEASIWIAHLSDLYLKFGEVFENLRIAANHAVEYAIPKIAAPNLQVYEKRGRELILEDSIYSTFVNTMRPDTPEHIVGQALAWQLAEDIISHVDCSIEEAFLSLTTIAQEALYDNAVDFSSPEQFVETVKPRLPEYLNNG